MSCCKFWPDDSVLSATYGPLTVNHIATVPKQDWEMTTLQVFGKHKVPANAAKFLDTSEYGKLFAYL